MVGRSPGHGANPVALSLSSRCAAGRFWRSKRFGSVRFLTFVNFAVGGPSNGWRLLSDSDFDWGQGLIDLRNWMNDQRVSSVALAYFGFVDPEAYGINFTPIIHPGKERYIAVSSYFLDGLENRIVTGRNSHGEIERACLRLRYFKLQRRRPSRSRGTRYSFIPVTRWRPRRQRNI